MKDIEKKRFVAMTGDTNQVVLWYKRWNIDPDIIFIWTPESEDDAEIQQKIMDADSYNVIIFDSWQGDLPDHAFFRMSTKYDTTLLRPMVLAGYIMEWREIGKKQVAYWSEEKEERLRYLYASTTMRVLAWELGYSEDQIREAARRLKLNEEHGVTVKPYNRKSS